MNDKQIACKSFAYLVLTFSMTLDRYAFIMILLDSYVIIIWNPSDSILSVSHEFERNKADIIKKEGAFLPISDARRGNFEKWYKREKETEIVEFLTF